MYTYILCMGQHIKHLFKSQTTATVVRRSQYRSQIIVLTFLGGGGGGMNTVSIRSVVWIVGSVVRQSRVNEFQCVRHPGFDCCLDCIHVFFQPST